MKVACGLRGMPRESERGAVITCRSRNAVTRGLRPQGRAASTAATAITPTAFGGAFWKCLLGYCNWSRGTKVVRRIRCRRGRIMVSNGQRRRNERLLLQLPESRLEGRRVGQFAFSEGGWMDDATNAILSPFPSVLCLLENFGDLPLASTDDTVRRDRGRRRKQH